MSNNFIKHEDIASKFTRYIHVGILKIRCQYDLDRNETADMATVSIETIV